MDQFFQSSYKSDYEELFVVARSASKQHYTLKQRLVFWPIILLFVGLVALMAHFSWEITEFAAPWLGDTFAIWLPPVMALVTGGLYIWLMCSKLLFKLSAKWTEERRPAPQILFSANTERLNWESDETATWVKWHAIEQVYVTPIAIAFVVGAMSHFVPRRAFSNSEDQRKFLHDCLQRLSEPAKTKSELDRSVKAALTV
jgi:hypothetical protein